ncbi:MAG: SCO family protein [Vulcanimicrobiaceae bacterium]
MALLGSLMFFLIVSIGQAAAHEIALHGLIMAAEPKSASIVVRHDALGSTPAGISTFRVVPASAVAPLRAGMSVDGLASIDQTPWTLSRVTTYGMQSLTAPGGAGPATTTKIFRNVHHVVVGEYAPAGDLRDQTGRAFTLRSLRGQTVVMAFVYSRCKDARECPLITSRFRLLQERFRGQPVHLVLVTLDPAFDTPRVLAGYGKTFGVDPKRWTLASGDPESVLDFAAQFDVTAFPDERIGLIHPERTVIVDSFGAIRELIDEGAWTPDQIVAAVLHDERLASNPIERLDLWLSAAAVSVCGNAVAGFSGFTDLLTVFGIAAFFGYLLWRVGRVIARGTT